MSDWDRSAAQPPPPATGVYLQLGLGIVAVFVLHAVVGLGLLGAIAATGGNQEVVAMIGGGWMLGIGVAQLPYVLPAVAVGWVVRKPIGLGMLIGAGLTFVLNSTCYGAFAAFAMVSSARFAG